MFQNSLKKKQNGRQGMMQRDIADEYCTGKMKSRFIFCLFCSFSALSTGATKPHKSLKRQKQQSMPKSKNIAFNKIQHKKPPQGKKRNIQGKKKRGWGYSDVLEKGKRKNSCLSCNLIQVHEKRTLRLYHLDRALTCTHPPLLQRGTAMRTSITFCLLFFFFFSRPMLLEAQHNCKCFQTAQLQMFQTQLEKKLPNSRWADIHNVKAIAMLQKFSLIPQAVPIIKCNHRNEWAQVIDQPGYSAAATVEIGLPLSVPICIWPLKGLFYYRRHTPFSTVQQNRPIGNILDQRFVADCLLGGTMRPSA